MQTNTPKIYISDTYSYRPCDINKIFIPSHTTHLIYIIKPNILNNIIKNHKCNANINAYYFFKRAKQKVDNIAHAKNSNIHTLLIIEGVKATCPYTNFLKECFNLWPITDIVFTELEYNIDTWMDSKELLPVCRQ